MRTLEERLDEWALLAKALPFDALRERIVERIRALFDPDRILSEGDLPGDDRIRELVGLALAPGVEDPASVSTDGEGLTAEQREELRRHLDERKEQIEDELLEAGRLLLSGARDRGSFDDAEAALLEDLPRRFAMWERETTRWCPRCARSSRSTPGRRSLPGAQARRARSPRRGLERIAMDVPSVADRGIALSSAPELFGERARSVYEKAIRDIPAPDPPLTHGDRRSLLVTLLGTLDRPIARRPSDPWLPEVTSRLFGWDPARGVVSETPTERGLVERDDPRLRRLWRSLPESIRARIEAVGGAKPGGS